MGAIKGTDGLNGIDGTTYTPSIKSVSTLDSDASAIVSVEVNEENKTAEFSFGIPKGRDGSDGQDADLTEVEEEIEALKNNVYELENNIATLKENNLAMKYHHFTERNEVWEFRGSVGLIYAGGSNYGHGMIAYSCGYNVDFVATPITTISGISVSASAVAGGVATIRVTCGGSAPRVVYAQEFSRPLGA